MYGLPTREILLSILKVKPIYENYKMMKLRASLGFLPLDIREKLKWK
jgi:hypothetical protein